MLIKMLPQFAEPCYAYEQLNIHSTATFTSAFVIVYEWRWQNID